MGNLPIGQGLGVTPMQMAAAYAAIANGASCAPRRSSPRRRPAARKPGPPRDLRDDRRLGARMLEGVLGPGGTASGADIDGYVLAGKTGTAEKPDEYRRLLEDQVRRLVRRLRARRAARSCS